jgi:UMP-CMP kinase
VSQSQYSSVRRSQGDILAWGQLALINLHLSPRRMYQLWSLKTIISAFLCYDLFAVSLQIQPYRISFVLGGPAAGKSTQCKKLVDDYGCIHLSAGDLLREERASGSSTAELIERYINEGAIVPVAITLDLIRNSMEKSKASRFLIDGFPRNEDNFLGWNEAMGKESCVVDSIIFIECPEEECVKRIIERAKTSGRSDDNLETLAKRFVTFNEVTLPVILNYEQSSTDSQSSSNSVPGKGVYRIAGARDIEAVYGDMKKAYEDMVIAELVQLSEKLLHAENSHDEECYKALVDSKCTIISSKSRVMDTPKKDLGPLSGTQEKKPPHVRVMGKSAVVSYTRQLIIDDVVSECEETRIWQLDDEGYWKNVHLHRVLTST